MKPHDKKRRKAMYTLAAKQIASGIGDNFLCGQFLEMNLKGIENQAYLLPEFGLFKPTREEEGEYNLSYCWFKINGNLSHDMSATEIEYAQIERMICLDLCLIMLEEGYLDGVDIEDIIG